LKTISAKESSDYKLLLDLKEITFAGLLSKYARNMAWHTEYVKGDMEGRV
jgi:hypothetical protein